MIQSTQTKLMLRSLALNTKLTVSVQCDLINKPEKPFSAHIKRAHGSSWENTILRVSDLHKHIKSGFAFCAASLTNGNRKTANFEQSQIILLDFDHNSITDVQQDATIRQYAGFGFTTPSHTEQNPRCKIAMVLDKPATDAALYTRYVESTMKRIQTVTVDKSGKDATRFSYGNQKTQWAFFGNVLPTAILNAWVVEDTKAEMQFKQVPKKPTAKNEVIASYSNITDMKRGKAWLDENARRIMGALGVTEFNSDGYSNLVRCPCLDHNNNDASPSAAWHRDKYHLHCFATGKNYTVKATAAMLGLQLDNVFENRRGLWNNTREFFLQHTCKTDTGRKIQPLQSFTRFNEAMVMHGAGNGWFTIKELDAALNGLFSDQTLRYSISKNLLSSKQYHDMVDSESDKGLFCNVFLLIDSSYISYNQVENSTKNYLTVPPPPQKTGNGRPQIYYFVPTEQEWQRAFGIERGVFHDWISLLDLQSNDAYTKALNRVLIEQRPNKYSQKFLAGRIGKSTRTIRNYVNKDPNLKSRRNERFLGVVDDITKLPVKPIMKRYLTMADTRTGEMIKRSYCRDSYRYLSQFEQPIYAVEQVASSYWSTKGKALPEDKRDLEQIA